MRAIRHYEAFGLLSPRRVGSARVYGAGEFRALTLILRFKAIGFSLTEMRRYLRLYGLPSPRADSESAGTVLEGEQALAALERRRQQDAVVPPAPSSASTSAAPTEVIDVVAKPLPSVTPALPGSPQP